MSRQIYVDMDGVLADFHSHYEKHFGLRPDDYLLNVDWKAVGTIKDFYLNIPPMPEMWELWDYLAPHRPIILTGIPRSVPDAISNKEGWVKKHLPSATVICCLSNEKYKYCFPCDILIDDRDRYKQLWVDAGGVWITHTSAKDTIDQLNKILRS